MKPKAPGLPIVPTEPVFAVSELFFSIQGESTYAGLPCVFIRLAGCNLRCDYCDARYSYEEEGRDYSLSEIITFVDQYPGAMVEITGGEPLLQNNVIPLMESLLGGQRTVLLETNGSCDISMVPAGVTVIMDVKCPGSGMSSSFRDENLAALRVDDEIKFVLTSRQDYEWAVAFITGHALIDLRSGKASRPLLFSPVPGRVSAAELADWILSDHLPVRLQLQLHKILWPASDRGC